MSLKRLLTSLTYTYSHLPHLVNSTPRSLIALDAPRNPLEIVAGVMGPRRILVDLTCLFQ